MKPPNFTNVKIIIPVLAFAFVLFSSNESRAENWVEASQGWWYNSDYTFVDRATGVVVIEVAELRDDATFTYSLNGVDCGTWYIYVIAMKNEAKTYDYFQYWKSDEDFSRSISPGSAFNALALSVCPDRNNYPTANINP